MGLGAVSCAIAGDSPRNLEDRSEPGTAGRLSPSTLSARVMPRFALVVNGRPDPAQEFNLCGRCAVDASVLEAVFAKKAGVPLEEAQGVPRATVPHISYDFAPQPVPCLSCARILSAEDD